jgi:hypothetical protein
LCPFNAAENADETHARAAVAAVPDDLRVDSQRERRVGVAHLYETMERGDSNCDSQAFPEFDTGVLGYYCSSANVLDPTRTRVDGERRYGKGAGENRQAYCAIWLWAYDQKASGLYPVQSNECPT